MSMEMKHTPGPWRHVDQSEMTPQEPFWIGAEHPVCGFVSHAVVRSGCTESDELGDLEANARLIAAAPDLLAALQGVLRVADRATDEFDAARAAIARALGKNSD
jgi:hypothetical protein